MKEKLGFTVVYMILFIWLKNIHSSGSEEHPQSIFEMIFIEP